jgi:ferric-dicitrate binding protein FerR (iron transport regulator)
MNDELLVKYLLGEATAIERNAVEHWVNASTENSRYFSHFKLIWDTSKQFVIPPGVNADDAWQRFQQRTQNVPDKPAIVRSIILRSKWLQVAAIFIFCTSFLVLAYFLLDRGVKKPVVVASSNHPQSETLPDGSVVVLNKNSRISYTPGFRDERRINLSGEAFFKVTPDKEKPFIIRVDEISVTVVGTSFNIKSSGGTTQVIVETGVVRVTKNNSTIELRPNEKVEIRSADLVLAKESMTDRLHQYYRSKEFVCDKTPLWKLVEVLNEAYNVKIVIESKELQSLPLTTTFYNESLDQILAIIAETFNISVQHKGEQILLSKP